MSTANMDNLIQIGELKQRLAAVEQERDAALEANNTLQCELSDARENRDFYRKHGVRIAEALKAELTTTRAQLEAMREGLPQLVDAAMADGIAWASDGTPGKSVDELIATWRESLNLPAPEGVGESEGTALRPIETAPRDGTPVLLKPYGESLSDEWLIGKFCSDKNGYWNVRSFDGITGMNEIFLAGWLPLPPASSTSPTNILGSAADESQYSVIGTCRYCGRDLTVGMPTCMSDDCPSAPSTEAEDAGRTS